MTVIARDTVAADHLVYAWPFPLGPECEVTCNDDEQVVMCPSWMVGDRLGPGRHHWRTPDPTRPVAAFFVLTAPVEVSFDMITSFLVPMTGQGVRVRAVGSIQVRCSDPGLLIAQFVGLPFDSVNEGILRSVSRSVERMLARLLTRRVVLAGTPYAVTDPSMLGQIAEELIAYNPTAGAVFGVELIRLGYLAIGADDGSSPYIPMPVVPSTPPVYGGHDQFAELGSQPDIPMLEAAHVRAISQHDGLAEATPVPAPGGPPETVASGEIVPKKKKTEPGMPAPPILAALGTNPSAPKGKGPEVARSDEPTEPGMKTPLPGSLPAVPPPIPPPRPRTATPGVPPIAQHAGAQHAGAQAAGAQAAGAQAAGAQAASLATDGAILGIGTGAIGGRGGPVSGEIPVKVAPGQRVLVPGPNGLMQSATVRQLLQGYYELEVGSSGQTIWVPISNVVPE
jgi:hypothetical protein